MFVCHVPHAAHEAKNVMLRGLLLTVEKVIARHMTTFDRRWKHGKGSRAVAEALYGCYVMFAG